MRITPSRAEFARLWSEGRGQLVATTRIADLDTPVGAMIKLADGKPYSFLLESVAGGEVRGRYSIIGLEPDLIWKCRDDEMWVNRRALIDHDAFEPMAGKPLDGLRALLRESDVAPFERPLPIGSGLFGHMTYDMVRHMERLPEPNPDELGLPDAVFMRPTLLAVFDTIEDTVTIITPARPEPGLSAEIAYRLAQERLARAVADLERQTPRRGPSLPTPPPEPISNTTREEYAEMVERAKAYIAAGDVFQVVPSQRFTLPFHLAPMALYRSLRRLNPSPFLFYLDLDEYSLVGSSPEIMVRVRDRKVTIRPIAGTRRRGQSKTEDKALAEDLLADPKEVAEHTMLLDLGRNDVGRVAEIGSVRVTENMSIENYSHVMHIVSNVEGELREEVDALDALIAGFPAGTVSGAPKIRAMEIIDELEKTRRGFYAGAVGYLGADGQMDTCIALRTGLVKDGKLYLQAGGGVVADSDPDAEWAESWNKAQALIRAAEEAVRYAAND